MDVGLITVLKRKEEMDRRWKWIMGINKCVFAWAPRAGAESRWTDSDIGQDCNDVT